MKAFLANTKDRIIRVNHKMHRLHGPAHLVYFLAVAVEAGKWYGAVAGGLAILTLVGLLAGSNEE